MNKMTYTLQCTSVIACALLVLFRADICDFYYLADADRFRAENAWFIEVFGEYRFWNPYNSLWNLLRDKLTSVERFVIVTLAVTYFRPFEIKRSLSARYLWSYFVSDREKNILTRCLIIFWQGAFSDFTDRLFCDIQSRDANDYACYAIIFIYYIPFTIYYAFSKNRKHT